ncbi:Transposase [Planctopirus ephydatiae]|uniref:Transposase n=2 Tax=Planctopirus ephydatiae TaxID=2528019 RepID=A0A518GPP6_9PLAN|nr:Transposase [Planctopirus ephydatiae]
MLRQVDVALGKGEKAPEVCKELGISEQTYYRWRTKYGGMDPQRARQLEELQRENAQLKRLVVDQALDNQILREAARPTGKPCAAATGDRSRSSPRRAGTDGCGSGSCVRSGTGITHRRCRTGNRL